MIHRPINEIGFGYPPGPMRGNPGGVMGYYGQYPEDELGYYGQYPEDELGYYGEYPGDEYGHVPNNEMMGDYGDYPDQFVEGYIPETEPHFNPRWGSELSGYEAEKSVNPECEFRRAGEITPPKVIPDIFKPYI